MPTERPVSKRQKASDHIIEIVAKTQNSVDTNAERLEQIAKQIEAMQAKIDDLRRQFHKHR